MKNVRLLLTALLVSICSCQAAWALTAPTFPEGQTLESGKSYYLYNIGRGKFIYKGSNTTIFHAYSYGTALLATKQADGTYTLKFKETDYYLHSQKSGIMQTASVSGYAGNYFRIEETEGGYTIQRNYNYNETEFVGCSESDDWLYSNFTEGNIVWALVDEDGALAAIRYRAKKDLYDAIVAASDYSFAIDQYVAIYEDEQSTDAQLRGAANAIKTAMTWTGKLSSKTSEFPIFIQKKGIAELLSVSNYGENLSIKNGEGGCTANLIVDQDATITYNYKLSANYSAFSFNVFVDGKLYQTIGGAEGASEEQTYFIELSKGQHTIEWLASNTSETLEVKFSIKEISAWKTPTITVNLTQPGSLGTEVLYNVDHVKEVKKLVVKGELNSEDWSRISMMVNLFELDLANANIESLPQVKPGSYFHRIKLPNSLKEIAASALSSTAIEEIVLPPSLTTIGAHAFDKTRIKEFIMPESVTTIGSYAFANNQSLVNVVWPSSATSIPNGCFKDCPRLNTFEIPEGVTSIGDKAFYCNYYGGYRLPSTITSIGMEAFRQANRIDSLIIPSNTSVGAGAFRQCSRLKYVKVGKGVSFMSDYTEYNNNYYTFYDCGNLEEIEFPTTFYSIFHTYMLGNCKNLKKVVFRSPTMAKGTKYTSFLNGLGTDIDIYVPSYLVNAYKLDPYWYNYNIVGFSTADVQDWVINEALTFYSQDRFEGTPNVQLNSNGAWTVNGETSQLLNNLTTFYSSKETANGMNYSSKLISNCDNMTINGNYTHWYYMYNRIYSLYVTAYGRWHFICLPFDMKVGDITTTNNASYAIRYYDGANRAKNGTGGNWKNYSKDDVIPAGTGFIVQVNKACSMGFKAQDNASKQNVVSNKMFVKALEANASEQKSNKGWNLVGNPWLCYYNIHKMNFTAPITVYDGYNKKYTAYSVIDDDYAIQPNEAFFVQCPDEVNSISFPIDGRQMTNVIESQNGAKPSGMAPASRLLIDIELTDGELMDKTRVVVNQQASTDYETECDASKFFDLDGGTPLIYSIENDEPLAINERPRGEGVITLGLMLPQEGTFTISTTRNDLSNAILLDKETGAETDLGTSDYTFSSHAGYNQTRFELRLNSGVVTSIQQSMDETSMDGKYYNLNGQQVDAPTKGVYVVNGRKVIMK